jgi:hypothetical protein
MSAQNSLTDYTIYADSNTRETKLIDNIENMDDNPTNDITIITDFNQRLNVCQLSLGSLEMSLAQYNIEPEWQELFFDEGLDIFVTDHPALEDLIKFSIDENGTVYTAFIPPKLNPIVNIVATGTDYGSGTYKQFIFTTQYPHCLHLMSIFAERQYGESPFNLISTLFDGDNAYFDVRNLNLAKINLTILDDFEYLVDFSEPTLALNPKPNVSVTPVTSILGYLSSPHIADMDLLAQLITASMDQIIPHHWLITYSQKTGKFAVKWRGPSYEVTQASPATLLVPNMHCLPFLMGLGINHKNIPIPQVSHPSPLTELQLTTQHGVVNEMVNSLVGQDCFRCRSKIEIDPGNYRPEQLMSNINRQLNRFYFDGGCQFNNDPWIFVYSNSCGECYSVELPFGTYAPEMLSLYLSTRIVNDGHIGFFEVEWDAINGRFVFTSDANFGLEFDQCTGDLALRMGFYPLSYRNSSYYVSPRPFFFPTKGCCQGQYTLSDHSILQVPLRNLSYIYVPVVIESERKFVIQISKPRPINRTNGLHHDVNTNHITFTTTVMRDGNLVPVAHGYQRFDVVEFTAGNTTYSLVVVEVLYLDQFVVDAGSIDVAALIAANSFCSTLGDVITTNMYFTCAPSKVLSKVLGFTDEDYLWSFARSRDMWIAPAQFTLDWPNYILIEITEPNGATRNAHNWENDKKSKILAKAILYPQYRMERSLPVSMYLPDFRIVNRIHIRLLNPDHTLYKLHGKEWSITLILKCLEKTLTPMCY